MIRSSPFSLHLASNALPNYGSVGQIKKKAPSPKRPPKMRGLELEGPLPQHHCCGAWKQQDVVTNLNQHGGPGEVLRVSSDEDDRMGAKIKTQKNPQGFQKNPQKSLDQKLTPKKSHAKFPKISKKD